MYGAVSGMLMVGVDNCVCECLCSAVVMHVVCVVGFDGNMGPTLGMVLLMCVEILIGYVGVH